MIELFHSVIQAIVEAIYAPRPPDQPDEAFPLYKRPPALWKAYMALGILIVLTGLLMFHMEPSWLLK